MLKANVYAIRLKAKIIICFCLIEDDFCVLRVIDQISVLAPNTISKPTKASITSSMRLMLSP